MEYVITNKKYKNKINLNLDSLDETFHIIYSGNYYGDVYKQILKKIYNLNNIELSSI